MENYNLDRGFVPTLQSQSVFFFYVEFFVTCLTFLVQISHALPVVTSRFYDCESNALKGEPDLCQYLYNQIRTLILTEICCGSTTVCIWTFTEKKSFIFFFCFAIDCDGDALGIYDKLRNFTISASSSESDSPPASGRIYKPGGWRALRNDSDPYLEVGFKRSNYFTGYWCELDISNEVIITPLVV